MSHYDDCYDAEYEHERIEKQKRDKKSYELALHVWYHQMADGCPDSELVKTRNSAISHIKAKLWDLRNVKVDYED